MSVWSVLLTIGIGSGHGKIVQVSVVSYQYRPILQTMLQTCIGVVELVMFLMASLPLASTAFLRTPSSPRSSRTRMLSLNPVFSLSIPLRQLQVQRSHGDVASLLKGTSPFLHSNVTPFYCHYSGGVQIPNNSVFHECTKYINCHFLHQPILSCWDDFSFLCYFSTRLLH